MERPSWAREKEVIRNRSKTAVERKIIIDNPKALEDAKNDPQAIHFLIGQVMKATKGRANHSQVKELIENVS